MDYHMAEAHVDGADGSPPGWSTCRWHWWITTWLKQMQMALIDYHVAETQTDGAVGLPRGRSTCRCRWRGAIQVILINQALRNYEEVHGSKMQRGNTMSSTVPRWLWEEPRGSKNSKVMRRPYEVDGSKDGATEVLCCQSRRSMTRSIYPRWRGEASQCQRTGPASVQEPPHHLQKFILIHNIIGQVRWKGRLKIA